MEIFCTSVQSTGDTRVIPTRDDGYYNNITPIQFVNIVNTVIGLMCILAAYVYELIFNNTVIFLSYSTSKYLLYFKR